jgi:hypothetical protein
LISQLSGREFSSPDIPGIGGAHCRRAAERSPAEVGFAQNLHKNLQILIIPDQRLARRQRIVG